MPTVSVIYCSGWDQVPKVLIAALISVKYPHTPEFRISHGVGNVACIVGTYDGGETFTIVGRNEGSGGSHSEPVVLHSVQHRRVDGNSREQIQFLTERAPCGECVESLQRWADTFGADIAVHYLVPYTDTDEIPDYVSSSSRSSLSASDARNSVAQMRTLFARAHPE